MRLILTTFVALITLGVSAQIQVTDSLIESFLKKEINNINLKLYNAAIEGKITAYKNHSFASEYSPSDLITRFGYEIYVSNFDIDISELINADANVKWVALDPSKDFEGINIVYEPTFDLKTISAQHSLIGVAPRYPVIAGEGIHLGYSSMFFVKIPQVRSLLFQSEFLMLSAIVGQNSQFGDFRLFGERFFKQDSTDRPLEYAIRSVHSNDQGIHDRLDYSYKIPLLSSYGRQIPTIIMSRIANTWDSKSQGIINKYLFKDINLHDAYVFPSYELKTALNISQLENGSQFDTIYGFPPFYVEYDYLVLFKNGDYIFDYTFPTNNNKPDAHIFMSFNAVKSLFPEQDRIVWEAFLKDLFTE